ncbi:hypothetical protein ASPZODRAFT_62406 [Penicilliopsis zonata CBS 506.65]|uniref:DNA polymerase eta n=1 Tax=Penicilliopsis zonata CBS 506.65 TaxID=1073090 RepID=A0A1L9SMV7_9EURO|nr:hypothetical protein ASPZODRAFT_62406 [Penicilliopsis zonata CBS 506.65]OJJ48384.1 hypothetical protein ASPZODRAFT_62406 [Penicilliopsis zonata CBS 506.65]
MSPSSPEPFFAPSSPISSVKRSQFTHRNLQQLRTASASSPLRVIAHIDLDGFYAQCEMVRLGTSRDTPLAVQQWDSLIAVNYAARPFGVSRMISAAEARNLCPSIILQHVATFREGEGGKWAYRDDAFKRVSTDKVSLDPYRAESRKIISVIEEELSRWYKVLANPGRNVQPAILQKAGIDEVFIDLSPLVFGLLLQRYPELQVTTDEDSKLSVLPPPPTTALEWHPEDCLVDLDTKEMEIDDPDWDDIAILLGSEIVRAVRKAVWDALSYSCSGGVAKNKMIAKLGSACNKPNKQTVVRNRAIQNFLGGYKFTKIRMLGGKLGDQVSAEFGTEQVIDLLKVSLEQFKAKFDDDTATWLYGIIRGEDLSEVNTRTQIKSMLSAKSFRPSVNSTEQAEKWLHIFAADIYNRLVEEGVLENRRRPKTITLYHRQGGQVRSRQIPIPASKSIDEIQLYELARTLLRQVVGDGRAWPCANLSLSVGGFEEGVTNNRAIDGFLLRGEEAKSIAQLAKQPENGHGHDWEPQANEKRRKLDNSGIRRFFNQQPDINNGQELFGESDAITETPDVHEQLTKKTEDQDPTNPDQLSSNLYTCPRCSKSLDEWERDEHNDWHFAKDLESQDRQVAETPQQQARQTRGPTPRGRGRGARGRSEKGQTRLAFS